MFFRRSYLLPSLAFHHEGSVENTFIFNEGRLTVTVNPNDPVFPESMEADNVTVADAILKRRNPKSDLMEMFLAIRRNQAPASETELLAMIAAAQVGVPWHYQTSVMHKSMPQAFQDYSRSLWEELDGAVNRFVGLIRWRNGQPGPAASISKKSRLLWSTDATEWHIMPFIVTSSASAFVRMRFDKARNGTLTGLFNLGTREPFYHELLREAAHLIESSPRSALALAVAAAEIAIKTAIDDLAGNNDSLLEKMNAPAILTLYRDILPNLGVRNRIRGISLRPPTNLLENLEKAVFARNQLVHKGTKPLHRESLIAKLNAIRDLLYLLDYYRGSDWAFGLMTEGSKTELQNMADVVTAQYGNVMATLRQRFDVIDLLKASDANPFLRAETAAFHGRKIVEGIAFACLLALEQGLDFVPRDARGQWNAEVIFKSLQAKGLMALPTPSILRRATSEEQSTHDVTITIEGQPDRALSYDDLNLIYQRLHRWNHELNPYTNDGGRDGFLVEHQTALWADLEALFHFLNKHAISIKNKGFFCVLRDDVDGAIKVIPISR